MQLRQKEMEAADELAALEVFADACKRHGKLLAVNDRADVAFAAGADVLHLGQRDLPVHAARAIIGPEPIIGRSTHTFSQVNAAVAEQGSDYFCVGPTWETPTKPGRKAAGLELVSYAASRPAGQAVVRDRRYRSRPARRGDRSRRHPRGRRTGDHCRGRPGCGGRGVQPAVAGRRVINNPKTARIVAAVVVAMLVITLAASLFGCAAAKPAATPSVDPDSGLRVVAVADLPKEALDTLKLVDEGGPYPYSRDGVVFGNLREDPAEARPRLLPRVHREDAGREGPRCPPDRDRDRR